MTLAYKALKIVKIIFYRNKPHGQKITAVVNEKVIFYELNIGVKYII